MTDMTPAEELERLAGTEQSLTESLAEAADPRTRELLLEGLRANDRRRRDLETQIEKEEK